MTPTTAIADKIKATGKPINAIANNAGVPPTTIYALFNGKCKNIGINTLFLICRYGLDVSLSDFLRDITDCEFD
ncbi:MAG: helix-turn-helix domain-containing protein [Oscillospiraceae bacterium]|nr:helix-turn-helix domain-containing protein [Oscillospiraceae bacterium]